MFTKKKFIKLALILLCIAPSNHLYGNIFNDIFNSIFVQGIALRTSNEKKETDFKKEPHYNHLSYSLEKKAEAEKELIGDALLQFIEYRIPFYARIHAIKLNFSNKLNSKYTFKNYRTSDRFVPGDIVILGMLCLGGYAIYKRFKPE